MGSPLYIIGSSGHAKVVIDAVEQQGKYRIEGLIDDFKPVGARVLNYPIVGNIDWLLEKSQTEAFFVFTAIGSGYHRETIYNKFHSNGAHKWATVIHPTATVSQYASVGDGSFIAANAIVAADAEVGHQVLLNHGAQVDHESRIQSYSTLSPGATLGGNVSIGLGSLVGANATVIERVQIGEHCVIGANTTVLSNVKSYSVAVGTPARVIKQREKNQSYFGG